MCRLIARNLLFYEILLFVYFLPEPQFVLLQEQDHTCVYEDVLTANYLHLPLLSCASDSTNQILIECSRDASCQHAE